ncbi:unnamed protein product [Spirodela intermedia]|uniref:Uncharacterized protein n=1 Tax=Spirodela intermedia TaxID=51605 RepID=A0A7I8JED3_SPIIN|nr:unnamed protein product [Spirodela intermedia]CAA6668125.1 unnamed protein product [Spirodela intermedia]
MPRGLQEQSSLLYRKWRGGPRVYVGGGRLELAIGRRNGGDGGEGVGGGDPDGSGGRGSDWAADIQREADKVSSTAESELWEKHSIYQVPGCIKQLNPQAYTPQVVSFGPYHHGSEPLTAMEPHKLRSHFHFFVAAVREVQQRLMDAYERLDKFWIENPDAFLKMMIIDGCFMLEVLRMATTWSPTRAVAAEHLSKDPIFSPHGMLYTVPYIKRDMLMLENQLPSSSSTSSSPSREARPQGGRRGGDGLVGDEAERRRRAVPRERVQEPAEHSVPGGFLRGGVLILPEVVVDDLMEPMFRNLMAMERLHVGAGNEVTSYVFFMDRIIDSARDVELLQNCRIIQNAIGSDKAVAQLFNSLSKDVSLDPNGGLNEVHNQVSTYCQRRWNVWRANLMETYFRSPWAFLSLAAAVFLLVLTVAQTIFTVLQWHQGLATDAQSPSAASVAPSSN